jgi:hypothetical protein
MKIVEKQSEEAYQNATEAQRASMAEEKEEGDTADLDDIANLYAYCIETCLKPTASSLLIMRRILALVLLFFMQVAYTCT